MSVHTHVVAPRLDPEEVAALLAACDPRCRHVCDFWWRQASSSPGDPGTLAFRDQSDHLVALAAWRWPWAAYDVLVREGESREAVTAEALPYLREVATRLDQDRGRPLPYWVEFLEGDRELEATLEAGGLTLSEPRYLILEATLDGTMSAPPGSVTVLPMSDQHVGGYVDAHRSAFGSESMTQDWRRKTLEAPAWRSSLDLVAVDDGGCVIGFCVGWLSPDGLTVQIEPLGVVEGHRRAGVAQALMSALRTSARGLGASRLCVEVGTDNASAIRSYTMAGFNEVAKVTAKGFVLVGKE